MPVVLFISVFLIAACGLIYELIAGTIASYLLGDSVTVGDFVLAYTLDWAQLVKLLNERTRHIQSIGALKRKHGADAVEPLAVHLCSLLTQYSMLQYMERLLLSENNPEPQ